MDKKQQTLALLDAEGIPYRLVEHPPAFDMEDIAAFGVQAHGHVAKNLFLRDSNKGRRHFLVTVRGDKRVDLAALGEAVGQRLSFASEGRLEKYLNLKKGEVTPLAVQYDTENAVEVFFDEDLAALPAVGVHPCDNTATVFLSFADLQAYVKNQGNRVTLVKL